MSVRKKIFAGNAGTMKIKTTFVNEPFDRIPMRRLILLTLSLLLCLSAGATHFLDIRVVDNEYLMLHFRDGEVHYRDDGTGPSAYLGHSFAEGDDTLLVFKDGNKVGESVGLIPKEQVERLIG